MLDIEKVERLTRLTRRINDAVREFASGKNEHKQIMLLNEDLRRLKAYLEKHAGVIK